LADTKQALIEHLNELRKTLVYCVISLFVCFVLVFALFSDPLMDILLAPIRKFGVELVYTTLTEVWVVKIKVAFIAGFVLSFPFISFFFWRFLRPALYANEKKMFAVVYFSSLFLFLLGVSFAFIAVLGLSINFFISFGSGTAEPMLSISKVVSYMMSFIIPFGLVFLLPLVVYVLTKIGIMSPAVLVKSRKYVIVVLAILAAILTPPDIISQFLLLFPMLLLWEISVVIAKRVKTNKDRQETTDPVDAGVKIDE
jgi:sec-independent protein translocase protein TatC